MRNFVWFCLFLTLPWGAAAQSSYLVAYNETTAPLVPLFRAVYLEIGIDAKFEQVTSDRAIAETNLGHYDADISRVPESISRYVNLVPTKEPIKTTELYAYVRKGTGIEVRKVDDLRTLTLGLIRGSKFIEDFLERENLDSYTANSVESFYKMLDTGRIDVALVTNTQLLTQSRFLTNAERVGPVLVASQSFHILYKTHVDLIPRIDAVLKAMRLDGRMAKLLAPRP